MAGALTVRIKDALKSIFFQALEGTLTYVKAGPFVNLSSVNLSVVADQILINVIGNDSFVVTEVGFMIEIEIKIFAQLKFRLGRLSLSLSFWLRMFVPSRNTAVVRR